ncbi:MAG: N-acetylglucosamine-6-phosphate deacetylase, partial [Blautia sp.]|nr:N-acetylglucosamine-6-phosphate deacetylase [Blautia sp.]
MIIRNVKVYTESKTFEDGAIMIRNGVFDQVLTGLDSGGADDPETLDGEGCYAIPGLIDLHFHGCMGDDFCDGSKEAIARIAKYEAS